MAKTIKLPKLEKGISFGTMLFVLGIVIAVVIGAAISALDINTIGGTTTALVVLGAVVGLLAVFKKGTIAKEEITSFLVAAIALIVANSAGVGLSAIPYIGKEIAAIVGFIAVFVVPIAVIVAIKSVWDIASK
jgi:hypothetical protein